MAREHASGNFLAPTWITLILGAWLFISPWIFGMAAGFAWNGWIVGILVVALSIAAMYQVAQWEEWVNLVLGVWLFFSPWILGYAGAAGPAWDSYIVGILIAAVSIWGLTAARREAETSVHV